MISINVEKPEVVEKEPSKSSSQQNLLRKAKEGAEKKMSAEKAQRFKKAGLVK